MVQMSHYVFLRNILSGPKKQGPKLNADPSQVKNTQMTGKTFKDTQMLNLDSEKVDDFFFIFCFSLFSKYFNEHV